MGLGELAGQRPGEHGGEPPCRDQAEVAAGGEHPGQRREGGLGVVDDLEGAVAADQVDLLLAHEPGERVGVALQGGDAVGDTALGAAAGQRGQGVGAGVDDGHLVAELGERDREPAGATTEVEDAQRPAQLVLPALDQAAHRGPHRRGPQGRVDAAASVPPLLFGHDGHLLCWVCGCSGQPNGHRGVGPGGWRASPNPSRQ